MKKSKAVLGIVASCIFTWVNASEYGHAEASWFFGVSAFVGILCTILFAVELDKAK